MHRGTDRKIVLAIAAWLGLVGFAGPASGAIDVADPLEIPAGREPPLARAGDPGARLSGALEGFRARGYSDLPVLATAALDAGGSDAPALAVEMAPSIPAIRFQVAERSRDPLEALRALTATFTNLPSLVWLATWAGAALGVGLLACAAVLVALALARSLGLHGHGIGHIAYERDPPSWPGALVVASLLAILPLFGIGPVLWLAVAGAVAAFRLTPRESAWIGGALLVVTALLGPALSIWASFATLQARDPAVLAAWRIERQQPLPGDVARLDRALAEGGGVPIVRLASAVSAKRGGDLDRVERLVADLPPDTSPGLRSKAFNLTGIVRLARGDVAGATEAFESAAVSQDSAAVLYNLSQTHGRGLKLGDQGRLFAAARELDPELVSRYTRHERPNVHNALIELPLPLVEYLRWAAAPSVESRELTRALRERLLGTALHPERAWLAVAVLGLGSLLIRGSRIRRCGRCLRAVCERCSPGSQGKGRNCARCASLFSQSATSDAQLRREQLDRDRARIRRTARGLAAVGLVAPGAARAFEGRCAAGIALLLCAASGIAILSTRVLWPVPPEVGRLAEVVPLAVATLVLIPAYAAGLREAVRRLREVRWAP